MATKPTITTVTGQADNNAFQVNTATDELADAIATCLERDGTDSMAGDLNMDGNKIQNVGAPANDTDAIRLSDLSDSDATGAASATLRTDLLNTAAGYGADLVGDTVRATDLAATTEGNGIDLIGNTDNKIKYMFDSVASMIAEDDLVVGNYVETSDYYTTQEGGGARYEIVAAATGTDDGGSYHDLSGSSLQAKLIYDGVVRVSVFGAKGDGATNDSTAIQNAFNYWITVGGKLEFDKDAKYQCDTVLTALRTSSGDAVNYVLEGNGATLDFPSLTGTATALSLGGNSITYFEEEGSTTVNNLIIDGPETLAPSTYTNDPSADTTGLDISYAAGLTMSNVSVLRHKRGYKTEFVFTASTSHVRADKCWIGLEAHRASNAQAWIGFSVGNARYGIVIRGDQTTSGTSSDVGIDMISFYAPRIEGCYIGVVIDAGSGAEANHQCKGISIHDPFMNNITSFKFILAKSYSFSNPSTASSWSDTAGEIYNFKLTGGRMSQGGGTQLIGDKTNDSVIGAVIQTAFTRSGIDCNLPAGYIMCLPYSNAALGTANTLDIYAYDHTYTNYVNIGDGSVRTNITAGGSKATFRGTNAGSVQVLAENTSDNAAAFTQYAANNDASGSVQLGIYGSNHAQADDSFLNASGGDLVLKEGGNDRIRITSTTGGTGGTGSAGAGNQYVELEISGVRYKLLHDGSL